MSTTDESYDLVYGDERKTEAFATVLWAWSFKEAGLGASDADVYRRVYKWCARNVILPERSDYHATSEELAARMVDAAAFLAAWADVGLPRVQTSHKFAASLMCTAVRAEDLAGVHLPWRAFEVRVPDRLLLVEGRDLSVVRVQRWADRDPPVYSVAVFSRTEGELVQFQAGDLGSLLCDEKAGGHPLSRVSLLARRLTAGVVLLMTERRNFVDRVVKGKRPRGVTVSGPPDHRLVTVGRPLEVDLRPVVREYLEDCRGRAATAPNVVSLVSGHWKRQPCGPGLADRRIIHVEPYWRGPRDAVILTRPRHVAIGGEP